jgi:hypothetical protein
MSEYENDLIMRAIEKGFIDHLSHTVTTVLLDWQHDEEDALRRFEKGLGIARRARKKMMEAVDGDPSMA